MFGFFCQTYTAMKTCFVKKKKVVAKTNNFFNVQKYVCYYIITCLLCLFAVFLELLFNQTSPTTLILRLILTRKIFCESYVFLQNSVSVV